MSAAALMCSLGRIPNRFCIRTGNGAPWNRNMHSLCGGDHLFLLCSIIALDVDTGQYVWHYHTAPDETVAL